uniref:Ribosomal RNA-processing protein 14/surfeit locus protein 6 C-terminal domain-containing protein n=2 Tax=Ascaris TaxID=6251 RepID=F1L5H5_ASCSU
MMRSSEVSDLHLLARIAATDQLIRTHINLIPINNWGFSDDIMEKLKQRKHNMVNQRLTPGEKMKLSNASKQRLARGMKGQCRRVGDVLDWMANTRINTKPKRDVSKNTKLTQSNLPGTLQSQESAAVVTPSAPSVKKAKISVVADEGEESPSSDSPVEPMETDEQSTVSGRNNNDGSEKTLESQTSKAERDSSAPSKPKSTGERKAEMKRLRAERRSKNKGDVTTSENSNALMASASENDKKMRFVDPLEGRRLALQKLQARIQQLRSIRKGNKSAQQYEEQRKLRRRASVIKRKEKKRAAKRMSQDIQKIEEPTSKRIKSEGSELSANHPRNDAGQLVYSKFDFIVKDDQQEEKKKDKRDKFVGKDYGRLLKKAEMRQERIEKIREKNPEKAVRIEENIRWNKAMSRVEGHKVKDNPELLRKGMKRKEKMKERSKEKWAKRMDYVKEKQAKQQEKRIANIQARRDIVKKKKLQKARKKGRIL